MKKTLAIVLALVLMLGTAVYAVAADGYDRPLIPHEVILDIVETYETENGVEVGPGDEIPIPDDIVEKYIGTRAETATVQETVATATEEPMFDYPVIPHEVILEIIENYKRENNTDVLPSEIPIPEDIAAKYLNPLRGSAKSFGVDPLSSNNTECWKCSSSYVVAGTSTATVRTIGTDSTCYQIVEITPYSCGSCGTRLYNNTEILSTVSAHS